MVLRMSTFKFLKVNGKLKLGMHFLASKALISSLWKEITNFDKKSSDLSYQVASIKMSYKLENHLFLKRSQ